MLERFIIQGLQKLSSSPPKEEKFTLQEFTMDKYWMYRILIEVCILLLSVYAAYLSWTCNDALGYTTLVRVIFAFFAFVFGVFYVIFYAIFRSDACSRLLSSRKG